MNPLRLRAMAVIMPEVEDHPNRLPFSGILTRVDQISDAAPGGSGGHPTYLPKAVAEAALPSLMGMGVSFTPNFDGHDHQRKLGIITAATIVDDAVQIDGFFYASDFPAETKRLKAEKDAMGFSFECQAHIQDPSAPIWKLDYCVFTGAAVLYKDLAAYTTTSLTAKAEKGNKMDEELKAMLAAIQAQLASVTGEVTALKAQGSAPSPVVAQVKPHVEALRELSAAMAKDGLVANAPALLALAAHMEKLAAVGTVPTPYPWGTMDPYAYYGENENPYTKQDQTAGIKAAAAAEAANKVLLDKIEAMGTQMADLKAAAFHKSPEPHRATLSPEIKTLLAKAKISDQDVTDGKVTVDMINTFLDAANIKGRQAIEAKLKLQAAGIFQTAQA